VPDRGEVWWVDLDPAQGHEQAGRRPALVISDDALNHSRAGISIVIPISASARPMPQHVELRPPDGGLPRTCQVLCEAVRSISVDRMESRLGRLSRAKLAEVEMKLAILLGL